MDYGALPPEVNSGRMYVGAGSGPMLAAAAAWDGLAIELYTTAASYGSLIAELTGVAGSGVGGDGRRERPFRGVDGHHCRHGTADGFAGHGGRGRL